MWSTSDDVQYKRGYAVQLRHIFSTSADVQYKQEDHKVLVQETTLKYFPMNQSLFFLIYSVKIVSSLWQDAKINSLEKNIKGNFQFLAFITMNSLFTLENLPF